MFAEVVEGSVTMSDDDVVDRFRELELERCRIEAEQALLVSVIEERSLAHRDGHRTINGFLRAELNCSTSEAAALRSRSRTVNQLDGVGEAWMSGRIGATQVKQLARARGNHRIVDRLGPFVPILVAQAEILDASDFTALVDETIRRLDEDGAHDARDEAIEHRNAHVSAVGEGVVVSASGGAPLDGAEMAKIFDAFVEIEFGRDVADRLERHGENAEFHDLARTDAQRRFDALVAIFRTAAASDGSTIAPGLVVNVVVDAATFAAASHGAGLATDTSVEGEPVDPFTGLTRPEDLIDELTGDPTSLLDRRCETADGVPVHAHDVLRAALSGHVRRVVLDSAGVVVDMGRRYRLFTGSAREAATMLLRRCEHPGCRIPVSFCEVDHADEWVSDDGATDQVNARVRCGPHNRDKTRHRWRSRRATNGRTYTIRADGTVMLPIGARPPDFGPEPDPPSEIRDFDGRWDELTAGIRLVDPVELALASGR